MPIALADHDQQRRREAPDHVQLRCRIEATSDGGTLGVGGRLERRSRWYGRRVRPVPLLAVVLLVSTLAVCSTSVAAIGRPLDDKGLNVDALAPIRH